MTDQNKSDKNPGFNQYLDLSKNQLAAIAALAIGASALSAEPAPDTAQAIEKAFAGVLTFSLPSVDHPTFGPHIEIGVKGADLAQVELAMAALREGAAATGATEIASS